MSDAKVIPIGAVQTTRDRLIQSLSEIIAKQGFKNLDVGEVAKKAGVERRVVFRYFGGLPDMVAALGFDKRFWPTAEELLSGDRDQLRKLSPADQISCYFKCFLRALLERPQTLDIMAWELVERNRYSKILESVRVRSSLEYFEALHGDIPEDIDLSAVVALLSGSFMFLAVRSRLGGHYGGLDLWDEFDRNRLEAAADLLLAGVFDTKVPEDDNT